MSTPRGIGTEATLAGDSASGTDATIATASDAAGARRSGSGSSAGSTESALPEIARGVYVVKGELARGGMGKILVAEDTRLGREVALKELLVSDVTLTARFEREVRTTARLQHPGIVAVYEAGRWPDGEAFYAMRLVKGKSLEKVVEGRTALADRLRLVPNLVHLAEAMAYAHDRGVIHRDLKPANVLVGDYGETVVIDWGLAKVLGEDDEPAPDEPIDAAGDTADALPTIRDGQLTQYGSIVGTPAYMPPEQARGEPVDKRADVYALGALVYHVLAGKPPFGGASVEQVLANVLTRSLAPLAEVAPGAPPELVTIVERAMQPDPDLRYPSARELADDLVDFQSGKLVASHHYTTWQLLQRWVRRHRAFVLAAVALLVGGGIIAGIAVREVLGERDRARLASLAALEEQGRRELVAGHPRRAATYLAQAFAGGRRDEAARTMLGEAMRAVDGNSLTSILASPVRSVAWVRDEHQILALTDAGDVYLVDPATGTRVVVGPPKDARPIHPAHWAVSHDGNWLALTDDRLLRLVDLEHRRARDITEIWNYGEIRALAVAPAGAKIAVRAADGVHVVELAHPDQVITLGGEILDAGFDAGGKLMVASTTSAGTVVAADPWIAESPRTLVSAMPLEFAAVCETGIFGGSREWDHGAFLAPGRDKAHEFPIEGMKAAACGGARALAVRDVGHQSANLAAPFAILDGAGAVDLGVAGEHAIAGHEADAAANVRYTAYGLDDVGRTAAAGTSSGELVLWELASRTPLAQIDAHVGELVSLAVDRTGERVVTGGEDGSVRVWTVGAWRAEAVEALEPHTATSADGALVARVDRDGVVLGDPITGIRLAGHEELVTWVGVSPPGRIVAAAARDQRVIAWDARSHAALNTWPLGGAVATGAIAGDGTIAIGDTDGAVTLLAPGHAEPIAKIAGNAIAVRAVAWSPDDRQIASAAGTSVRISDRDGTLVRLIEADDDVAALAWVADGEQLAITGIRGVQIWAARGGQLLALPAPYAGGVLTDPPIAPASHARSIVRFDPSEGAMVRWTLARIDDDDGDAIAARIAARVPWRVSDATLVPTAAPVEHTGAIGKGTTFLLPDVETAAAPTRPGVPLADSTGAIANAAALLARGGHRDEARAKLGAAGITSAKPPDDPALAYTYAWALHWLGDDAAAFAVLAKAGAAWRDDATRAAVRAELRAFAAWASVAPAQALAPLGDTFAERAALADAYAAIGRGDLAAATLDGAHATDPLERMRLELARTRLAADAADPVATADHLARALEAAKPSVDDIPVDAQTTMPGDCFGDPETLVPELGEQLDTPAALAAAIEREAVKRAGEAHFAMLLGDYRYVAALQKIYDAIEANLHFDNQECRAELDIDVSDERRVEDKRTTAFAASIVHAAPPLQHCFARTLDAAPKFPIALDVRLTLSVRGLVESIDVAVPHAVGDDTAEAELVRCARGALAHYSFPRANTIGRALLYYRALATKTHAGPS